MLSLYRLRYLRLKCNRRRFPFPQSTVNFSTGHNEEYDAALTPKYEKMTQLEHVLRRSEMYIGDIAPSYNDTWILDSNTNKMKKSTILYSSGLLKLFDEILVNAADNKHRDKKMSKIDVSVEIVNDKLKVCIVNDGKGVPIELHETEKIYIPELIFGHLLTGSNFDDSQSRLTGGRHGFGAKLTNIFSNYFEVETYDNKNKLHYYQRWDGNMMKASPPVVTKTKRTGGDYTSITFEPDLSRFKSDEHVISLQDLVTMYHRRTIDVAACVAPVQVSFNSKPISVNSFVDYVNLFSDGPVNISDVDKDSNNDVTAIDIANITTDGTDKNNSLDKIFSVKVNDRWEVAVKRSHNDSFEHMSFVNSVWTPRGGSHVNYVTQQIVKSIEEVVKKKSNSVDLHMIRNKLMVFVKCSIENPSFDSQSKDALTSKPSTFGSTCQIPKSFIKNIMKESGIVEDILIDISQREQSKLLRAAASATNKNSKQLIDVPKLEDAHFAGSARSTECTLILTEGDSAKALAVAGLEVVGRELFGVLPLRGKILNVRVATTSSLTKNEEIMNICKALGLDFHKKYDGDLAGQGLRYGKVMMMCDQDNDGSHIKGLIINFFHHFWPNLVYKDGFLQQFITPLVKYNKGKNLKLDFYSMPEFEKWVKSQVAVKNNIKMTDIKYYKGLGTNTAEEGKAYFKALEKHKKTFFNESVSTSLDAIDLVFSKERAEDRRKWLLQKYKPESFINPEKSRLSYEEFINKELIQFSFADNQRSIPSVVDGLKPAQRKILYGCFKKNLDNDIKVVQLAGYIAEQTAYHHGEASLHATIINMAQDFVGSNNLPLLVPSGQFGTRSQGGKDFASPRYIFTRLSAFARLIFPATDDLILDYQHEDGQLVEPKYFVPIIPYLLVNGSEGIGTGWSTNIPPYNINDVVDAVSRKVRGVNSSKPLKPWFKNFKGDIKAVEMPNCDTYVCNGRVKIVGKNVVEIDELPVGKWTNDYKDYLCKLVESGELRGFAEDHTTEHVKFILNFSKATYDMLNNEKGNPSDNFSQYLKLATSISLGNMHAFNSAGQIMRYSTPEEVIDEHYAVRIKAYVKRKEMMSKKFALEEAISRNKSRFVDEIIRGDLSIINSNNGSGIKENELQRILVDKRYPKMKELRNISSINSNDIFDVVQESEQSTETENDYEYLYSMPIHSLTEAKAIELRKQSEISTRKYNELKANTPEDLWISDLNELSNKLKKNYKN